MAALEDSIRETLKDGIHFQAVLIECLNPQAADFETQLAAYQATRQGLKRQLAALNSFRREREDLEDEVNIQNVVIKTLGRNSADYAEQLAGFEATKKNLKRQMAELNKRTIEMFNSGDPIANGRMDVEPRSSPPRDWVSPTLGLPTPTLSLDFRISCQLNPILRVGEGPWGQRNWISFKGGEWTAKWGRGTIEPGGQDSQLVLPASLHTFVSTNYLLRTNDEVPAFITVQTTGWRTGPREVLERLFDPEQADGVDPSEYSFRLSIKLETGDERYSGIVNSGMWVGSGARKGSEVIYDAYRVL